MNNGHSYTNSQTVTDLCSDVGKQEAPELTKELQNHVKHATAPYKYPRVIEYVDELPKTIGGKIKRAQIRKADEG